MSSQNACTRCGAGCAAFRISFDSIATNDHPDGAGHTGRSVTCMIYDCREFLTVWGDNAVNPLCAQARAGYGLIPLGGF